MNAAIRFILSFCRHIFKGTFKQRKGEMGCFWGKRDNNSYADTTITASDGTSYKYGTVFTEKTTKGEGIACSSYANCYIGCSCNISNGWYSTCQGSDCKSATDNHYTGVNSLSAGKSISDVASISASGANSGISAMASGATTCYKMKTCSEGGYFDSVPADQKCSSKSYNGYSCYTGCSYKTCSDYGYNSSIPSGKTCETVHPRSGLTCYKDCKDESVEVDYYTESRQEYSSAIGQNDNNLYLVIKSDRPADKNYTVNYDGYARFNGGYIPGPYADSHDGACEGSMMNIHSCTLKQGETKVECLLYECPCQNLWWDGTLSPYW